MQRLDEVQSYMLLRRWQTGNKGEVLSAQLTAAQLESLTDFYTNERAYIAVCQRLLIPLSQSEAPFHAVLSCVACTTWQRATCPNGVYLQWTSTQVMHCQSWAELGPLCRE